MSPVSSAEVFTLPATCIASKGEQKKAMNVELASARAPWNSSCSGCSAPRGSHRMTSLQPTLPKSNEMSPQEGHMHCKHKKRQCPSQCSECPSPMDPIPLAVAAAPPGVHRMPSLQPRLPGGRAQRFKCPQSAAQRFSPYLPHALQANESKKRQ